MTGTKFVLAIDQDGTMTPADTIFRLFQEFGKRGRGHQVYKWSKSRPEEIEREFGVERGSVYPGMDIELVMREILEERGKIGPEVFSRIADESPFNENVQEFFDWLRNERREIEPFIVTATYAPIAERMAERLGIGKESVNATKMLYDAKGNAVKVLGPAAEGERKAEFVRELSGRLRIPLSQFIGVGDSKSDGPFLREISRAKGLAITVKGSREVVEACEPSIVLKRPDFFRLRKEIEGFVRMKQARER